MITIENLQLGLNELKGTKGLSIIYTPPGETPEVSAKVLAIFKGQNERYCIFGDIEKTGNAPHDLTLDELLKWLEPYLNNCVMRLEK